MGLRFRKSFKLAPGIRMTMGTGGASFNFGPRGASVSIGKRGAFANSSAFGLSSRTRLSSPAGRQGRPSAGTQRTAQSVTVNVSVGVTDQGDLYFCDASGNALPEAWAQAAKKQHPEALKQLIQGKCEEVNAQIEAIGELHRYTPSPLFKPSFSPLEFPVPKPDPPKLRKLDFLARIFAARRRRIEAENEETSRQYSLAILSWENDFTAHRQRETLRKRLIEELIYHDVEAMEQHFQEVLQEIAWPRETTVALELQDSGQVALLDVDLPEVEDMPKAVASVPVRGLKLSIKDMTATQIQRLYMRHVHAIGFRIIGETFAALPTVQQIVLSGYSQRRDRSTGQLQDEYLLSVRVARKAWQEVDFSEQGLAALDVVNALERFDLRRSMSKNGVFKPIIPFG
ncbi:DUF4236 domain-containing protein [Ahniella affigens]|uniref:DUF4236 domain-containing protein n=1 Tax=Ahniella affigens TaxID=2021234 RepID=A0A2P1PVN7_9GAMM|nr:DUF4236 domain-containing protein [Ahniella affigens]AVP98909.1 DUF4236 domain-containing protein [Ahniella affigens]